MINFPIKKLKIYILNMYFYLKLYESNFLYEGIKSYKLYLLVYKLYRL